MFLKIQNLSLKNKNKYHIFLKKKHKIIAFLGFFEINNFQKLTIIKLNFLKILFYLKYFKLNLKNFNLPSLFIKKKINKN